MCKQGYQDALHFLKKNGKALCLQDTLICFLCGRLGILGLRIVSGVDEKWKGRIELCLRNWNMGFILSLF